MSIDPNKLTQALTTEKQKSEDAAYKRTSKVTDKFFYRVTLDENDKVAEVVEVLLGLREGGVERVAEILGVAPAEEETRALPAANKARILPLFDENDQPEGTGLPEEKALELGYVAMLNGQQEVTGYKKPRAASPTTPMPATPGDQEVPVHDKRGDTGRRIKIRDGIAHPGLEAVPEDDGKGIKHFREKARVTVSRRRP